MPQFFNNFGSQTTETVENPFYNVMKAYSDEKLIEAYKNRLEYTPEAAEAMELILLERNLVEKATRAVQIQKEIEAISQEEVYNRFQRSEFGRVIADADFAQECLKKDIYFQRYISPFHHYNWLNHLFVTLGIIGAVLSAAVLGTGEWGSPFNVILVFSLLGTLLLPWGIWRLFRNKVQISIIKKNNGNVLFINGTKDRYEIPVPFRYECYWEWHYIKLTIKQVKLSVFIFDDRNNVVIELRELLELYKSPPPHWETLPRNFRFKDQSSFTFLNHGTQKPFLYRLQKILNGLHEEDKRKRRN